MKNSEHLLALVVIAVILLPFTFSRCASSVLPEIEPSEAPFRFALISASDVCVDFYIKDYEESVRIRHAIDGLREQNRDYWDGKLSNTRCRQKSVKKHCRIAMDAPDRAEAFAMTDVGSHILDSGIFRRKYSFEDFPSPDLVFYVEKGARVFSHDVFGDAGPFFSACKSFAEPEQVSNMQCQSVLNLNQMVGGVPVHQWVDPVMDFSQQYVLRLSAEHTPEDYPSDLVAKQLPPVRVFADVFLDVSGRIIDVRSSKICSKDGKHMPYSKRFISVTRSVLLNRTRILNDLYRDNGEPVPFVWSTSITFTAPERKEKP
ncbi:MAG: hypothetical protein CVV45_08000 [Spirochaetae bacterium HGW-Spirochaetae-10]|jgi:hypothetical protein|nr:MAG: hypothetical protein CVV45_08000 [Spirochaetae bacterium HGW-Spirochaetae-10]